MEKDIFKTTVRVTETCNSIKRSLDNPLTKEKGKFYSKIFGLFNNNII